MTEPACSSGPARHPGAGRFVALIPTFLFLLLGALGEVHADSAQYFYDPAGRLTAMIDPVNGSAQYKYDAVGNVLSVVRMPIAAIMVAQVSPSQGVPGTVVTIFGTGFDTTSDTTVSFNGQPATPTAVSATQITVAVPSGAASGPVSVTSPAGTAASAASFIVPTITSPAISGVSPGQADQGSTITISGSGFDPLPGHDKVFVNGRYALVTGATESTITAVIAAGTSGSVTVVTPGGSATSADNLVVPPLPYLASSVGSVVPSAIGSSATSAVGTAGQIGIILFNATAGQSISMQVTASSFSSATLALYGPDGAQIGPSTAVYAGAFFGTQTLTLSGTYTVVIAPASTATGSATVELFNAPVVTAAIAASATPVTLTTAAPGQTMSLTFSGTAGQRVSIVVQIVSGLETYCGANTLLLVEPDRRTDLLSTQTCGAGGYSGLLILPTTGTYTIEFDPAGTSTGTATFALYTVPPDATGPFAANAAAVTLTTTAPGQNMVLTFSGTAGQRVSMVVQIDSGLNTYCGANTWQMLEPDGVTDLFSTQTCGAGGYSGLLILPTTGIYTISFEPSGAATGTATFTLYTVPPDATAPLAANGTGVTLTTTAPGQNMVLTFSGTAGQRVSMMVEIDSGLNTHCGVNTWQMLEPDGVTDLFSTQTCGAGGYSGLLILPTTGTYTIAFDPTDDSTGTATITLYTVPPDATAPIAANGTPVTLTTTAPGQNMSLTFTGTAGQRVSMLVQIDSGLNTHCGVNTWQMLEPDGVTDLFNVQTCGSGGFSDVLLLPTTGTYTIAFDPTDGSTGTATFTLYNEPADASATITPGGATVSLTTTTPGQNMSLVFSGTAGQRVSLLVQLGSGLLTYCDGDTWQMLEPDGVTALFNWQICGSSAYSGLLVLPTTGTYTVKLNPAGTLTGTASFTLYSVPPDVTGSTTVGQAAVSYTTTVPGQAIDVTFAGTANQSVTVSVGVVSATPANPCYQITTLEPDGVTVLRGDQSCSSGYSSGSLTLPQGGTYTVVVAPTGTSIGTFSVAVSTP